MLDCISKKKKNMPAGKSLFLENWAVWWKSKTSITMIKAACLSSLKQKAFPNQSWHDTNLCQLWKWPKISRAQVQDQCPSSWWTCASRAQCVTPVAPCQQRDRLRRRHGDRLSLQDTKKYCGCQSTWKAILWWKIWIETYLCQTSTESNYSLSPSSRCPHHRNTSTNRPQRLSKAELSHFLSEKMKSLLLILPCSLQSLISVSL